MRYLLFFLTLSLSLTACQKENNYEGKWRLDLLKLTNNELDYPSNIYIENDSIKFNYWAFDHWHKFPLEVEENKFLFNGWKISHKKIKDTIFIKGLEYVNDKNDSIYNWWFDKPITEIKLPKINSKHLNSNKIEYRNPLYYILFGKPIGTDNYKLQLNDKHTEISELMSFINTEKSALREELIPFYNALIFIDTSTPMKYVEDIFYYLTISNQYKVSLINNINISYNDSIGLYYDYSLLNKKLPLYNESDKYGINTSKRPIPPPPPPPPYFPFFDNQKLEPKFLLLKKDTIYHNNKVIETSGLKTIVKQWVKNKNAIFSLYDLESTYSKFLELTAIINSVYQNERDQLSKTKFIKPLNELSHEEITSIKLEIPMYHVWSYSIPHYNTVIENNKSFFCLNVNAIN